ncbi:hypothetical protein AKO1_002697, partial [Acrasis kona]
MGIKFVVGSGKSTIRQRDGALQFAVVSESYFENGCKKPCSSLQSFRDLGIPVVKSSFLKLFDEVHDGNVSIEDVLDKLGHSTRHHFDMDQICEERVVKK